LKLSVRAEELTLEQWVSLSELLDPHPCAALPPPATESLDVVNENDEMIDTRPRGEIHEKGLLHRAVHIFLLNRTGQ
jgi:16S rRNA (adenine1518-N6/adenine1519-N6)-dimethyltransferase